MNSSPLCADFQNDDPAAFEHCLQWLPAETPNTELDLGILYTNFHNPLHPEAQYKYQGDEQITAQEYYEWTFQKINSNYKNEFERARSLYQVTGVKIPYLFTDYNSRTIDDEKIYEKAKEISRERNPVQLINNSLATWKLKPLFELPTQNALETIQSGGGNCLALDMPYLGLLLLGGFSAHLQSVPYDERRTPQNHVQIAFRDKEISEDLFFDPTTGLLGPQSKGLHAVDISFSEVISRWYVNQYREGKKIGSLKKQYLIETALKLAPLSYTVLEAGINFYSHSGDQPKAEQLYHRALEVYPASASLLENQYQLAQR